LRGRKDAVTKVITNAGKVCQMVAKRNPLKLNRLQLKTLTILQALVTSGDAVALGDPAKKLSIPWLPSPHGNHFHVGDYAIYTGDASGLENISVWTALARKGLVEGMPPGPTYLTNLGATYDTGLATKVLHKLDH